MHEVLRRFDRETDWLATGLLGSLMLAVMAVGVQLQKHRREQVNLRVEPTEVGIYHSFIFQHQSDETETATTPDLNSDVGRQNVQASPPILETQQIHAQVRGPKISITESRPSRLPRIVDVKRRLIELWHQSLARAERRGWTLFQNSSGRDKKKVSYARETRH
jgi:hypothetical protein